MSLKVRILQNQWRVPSSKRSGTTLLALKPFTFGLQHAADFSKPPEQLSYPHQSVVTCSGLIWTRYSTVIIPKNWNLVGVNLTMAGTGLYQLTRKIWHDYFSETQAEEAKE